MNEDSYVLHIDGQKLSDSMPEAWRQPVTGINAMVAEERNHHELYLTEDVFSTHVLALGSIGSGKSNFLYHVIHGILNSTRSTEDRMIFFDPKGDYRRQFERGDSVVLGAEDDPSGQYWNIFTEIMHTPESELDIELLRQIATTLFQRQIETSNNPVFPNGARDLFVGLTRAFIEKCRSEGRLSFETMNNASLKRFFETEAISPEPMCRLLSVTPGCEWMQTYLLAPQSATTQSYLAPLHTMVNEVFVGCFARAGTFSITKFAAGQTREKQLFIEYDPEKGCINDTVYTALLDMAMRESIGRHRHTWNNLFFVLDEFPMIPALTYIDKLLQYGRSLGVKIIAAVQNYSQLVQKYGEAGAMSIFSGFSTVIAFRLFDNESRSVFRGRHGSRLCRISALSSNVGIDNAEQIQLLDVITDWDLTTLHTGQCIISPPRGEPFHFYAKRYEGTVAYDQRRSGKKIRIL